MGQAGAVIIPFMLHKHLGLMFQPSKCCRMNDAVAIALVTGAGGAFLLGPVAAVAHGRNGRIARASGWGEKRPQKATRRRLGHWQISDYITTSVVNLKLVETAWHPRLGTSNSRTTLESIDCKCGFESEIRSQSCPEVSRIADSPPRVVN